MAKRQWQQGIILASHPDENGNFGYMVISRKTGFQDVWIGDHHLYYNAYEQNNTGTVALKGMIAGIRAKELKKKGQMVIIKGGRK